VPPQPIEIPEPLVPFDPGADEPISVQVDAPFSAEVDAPALARAIATTLARAGQPDGQVTLVITDDEAVSALNQQYRAVAGPTDVLSFSAQEDAPGFVSAPEAAAYLGDIIIALPFTRRQAADLGHPLAAELQLLAVHGTLHLLGYDHAEPEEEAAMWARQDAVLAELQIPDSK
jgi:probable rRNA maturation factor